jgi:hypothetical protein
MKAIIEIDLEIDGEWRIGDTDTVAEKIMDKPHHKLWVIDKDRLIVFANSRTIRLREAT